MIPAIGILQDDRASRLRIGLPDRRGRRTVKHERTSHNVAEVAGRGRATSEPQAGE